MGIRLDWDVESDLGRDSIEEDATVIAAEKRRRTLRTRVLIGAVVLIALAAGLITWRLRIVNDELEQTLRATVEAETLALRIGDKHKFMQLQGPAEDWRSSQRENFDRIQAFQPRAVASGEILDLKMAADEARVTLEIVLNGESTQAIWLYDYTDSGWKHIATELEPWREITKTFGLFTFTYNTVDQRDVNDMTALFEKWWLIASRETATLEPLELEIQFNPHAREIRWKNSRRELLIVPPAMLERDASGQFDAATQDQLAVLVSEKWAAHAMNLVRPKNAFEQWAVHQLAIQLTEDFGAHTDEYSAFVPLAKLYGENFVPVFMTEMRRHDEPDAIAAIQFAMREMSPPEADANYYKNFLEVVATILEDNPNWLYNPGLSQAPFIEHRIPDPVQINSSSMDQLHGIEPGTVRIVKIERFQEVDWVAVSYKVNSNWWEPTGISGELVDSAMIIPFRKVDGYWKMAAVRPEDWGQTLVETQGLVTFSYPELDATFFMGASTQLEAIYLEAAETFGIKGPPAIEVVVTTTGAYYEDSPEVIDPEINSPRVGCCYAIMNYAEEQSEFYFRMAIYSELFSYQAGRPSPFYTQQHYAIESALLSWVWEKHGQDSPWLYQLPETVTELRGSADFDKIWQSDGMVSREDDRYGMMLDMLGARVMIDMLTELFGEDSFVQLVQNVRTAETAQEWITTSIEGRESQDYVFLEMLWQERFLQEVRDVYGLELLPIE